jgi:hypothetical protein
MKRCPRCQLDKPLDRWVRRTDGRTAPCCRDCNTEICRLRREAMRAERNGPPPHVPDPLNVVFNQWLTGA